jgi:hypothetical protein
MPEPFRQHEIDWDRVHLPLDERGFALIPSVLTKKSCEEVTGYYDDEERFRSRIDMSRYAFGRGEYKYFNYPLPEIVQQLRSSIYPRLAPLANQWSERLGNKRRYPESLSDFIGQCHRAGQKRPTPLLLKYGAGDFNCLHQDLYGEHVFPLQVTILLSKPDEDFVGGEFVMTRQVPRRQSQVRVAHLDQGDALVFAVNSLPIPGRRGPVRATMRHGVSPVTAGQRHTLGIVFHDAL